MPSQLIRAIRSEDRSLIREFRLPDGTTLPPVGSEFEIFIEKFGIYSKHLLLVEGYKYSYKDVSDSDGYGNYGETSIQINMLSKIVSFETNKPEPPPEPEKKDKAKKLPVRNRRKTDPNKNK